MKPRTAPVLVTLSCAIAASAPAPAAASPPPRASASGSTAPADSTAKLQALKGRVATATVTLPQRSCAGVLAEEPDRVVTAAHCIPEEAERIAVTLSGGARRQAALVHLDRARDLALLELGEEASMTPLPLADQAPPAGARLLFVGRIDRTMRPQVVEIDRVGSCPSVPQVENALFTTAHARRGDSGAPLVDESGRVVGLIHGGARCHIAVPTAPLAALGEGTRRGEHPDEASEEPEVVSRHRFGPFLWERTTNGFRFGFSFFWEWNSGGAERDD